MTLDFDKYAGTGNKVVRILADDLQTSREKAGRILTAVLHSLRHRLTVQESFQLMAQLPMALKAVYVDGWKYKEPFKRIHHVDEFLDEIREEDGKTAAYDFGNNEEAKKAVIAVFRVLNLFVSEGEVEDVVAVLPKELKEFVKDALGEKRLVL
jgi:uncharacterized protein (DUF2267 family)